MARIRTIADRIDHLRGGVRANSYQRDDAAVWLLEYKFVNIGDSLLSSYATDEVGEEMPEIPRWII